MVEDETVKYQMIWIDRGAMIFSPYMSQGEKTNRPVFALQHDPSYHPSDKGKSVVGVEHNDR